MDQAETPRIRNVALVGHSGVGKTTLVEALLHRAGVIPRPGRVEEGSTVCDTEPEEIKRGITLSPAVAPFRWTASDGATYRVNLVDTPGYADFVGSVDAALAVADLAVLVVSAVDGVEVGTEVAWRQCVERGIPRLVFVTKEDKQRADFHRVLDQLRERFGAGIVPLELPLGEEERLHGVADVLSEKGFEYEPDGTHHAEPLPDDVADEEHRLHDEVTEEIVSGDDDQLERYLSGDVPSAAELERTLAHEVLDGTEVPVLLGSALTGVGIDRLADYLCEIGPAPRPVTVHVGGPDGQEVVVEPDPDGEPLLHVFRTVADPFVGQVSLFKVLSGTVRNDDRLVNATTGAEERLHGMFHLRGKEHLPTDAVVAGDIAAVAKLADSPTGSTLGRRAVRVVVDGVPARPPAYALALTPVTQSDDDKLSGSLARLCAEDPTLSVDRTTDVGAASGGHSQTVLRGAGDVHLAVALERLARKFGVNVTTAPVRVAYRETIAAAADVEGKVKKQSGGHGQFAVVQLRVSPRGRGEGAAFVDSVVGGSVPRNYIPAVERGVMEAMEAGGLHGFPVVDVRVELYDGKFHSVDSSDMAFRTAAAHGLREALQRAGTVVLEPVSLVTVTVPAELQGDVLGDLSGRRGRISGSDVLPDGRSVIEATVPEAELARYVLDLRSLTGGRGSFTAEHSHYDVVPSHLVDKVAVPVG
ncbi:elongation factor G [Cellulomonas carbonis]|uniref:GTP-binding protein n=1 Tax=Cellulomonas carbonis T26 TaxID=947969 RepID=A0A0A0BWG8_9CELL|nr:elongation factor G [Cellulomonas carbonis]KGM11529.1 GTP-binding protein [Cellulomonas carbonis T26]GGC02636.1 elongation factor G [Cellulomonas carbonis]